MAVQGKMKLDQKIINRGSTRPQIHFDAGHNYNCDCKWIEGDSTEVHLSVVTNGDGGENSSFAAATPSGDLHLTINNPKAADYFQFSDEFYVEIRKARS